MAKSREQARELIESGAVSVNGLPVSKADRQISADDPVAVKASSEPQWVSRGAHKLLGALAAFGGIEVSGKICLDAGASTGGFTEVLLTRGAHMVYAIDVGYGQLAWKLQNDPRVAVMDRFNVRNLVLADLQRQPELIVADLSFISLRTVLPALAGVAASNADLLLMVKPQFEVGKDKIGKKGVVRDPELRLSAVRNVAHAAQNAGLGTAGVAASPLPGPNGNVEYFLWLRADAPPVVEDDLVTAIAEGPSK